jgi:hypothetical protein
VPGPDPNPRRRRLSERLLSAPLFALAIVWVLFDDLFRSLVKPAVGWLATLRPFARIEAWVRRQSPYVTLALFLVPLAIIEPMKLLGLYYLGQGQVTAGVVTFVVAKIVGIGLAERLFALSRDKLLSIRWFAVAYGWVIGLRDRVHDYLRTTRFWPALVLFVRRIKDSLRRAKLLLAEFAARWRGRSRGAIARRFAVTRRLMTRLQASRR